MKLFVMMSMLLSLSAAWAQDAGQRSGDDAASVQCDGAGDDGPRAAEDREVPAPAATETEAGEA